MKRVMILAVLALTSCKSDPPFPVAGIQTSTSASAAPAPSAELAFHGTQVDAQPAPELDEEVWTSLYEGTELGVIVGRWVSIEHGDAIPAGMAGGEIVGNGIRVDFVHHRKGSKTPWNLTFWAPRFGHMLSTNISGGCGFYDEPAEPGPMNGHCRGYGLPARADGEAHRLSVFVQKNDDNELWLQIGTIFDEKLRR